MSSLPDLRCGTGRSVAKIKLIRTSNAVQKTKNKFANLFSVGINLELKKNDKLEIRG